MSCISAQRHLGSQRLRDSLSPGSWRQQGSRLDPTIWFSMPHSLEHPQLPEGKLGSGFVQARGEEGRGREGG